MRYLARNGVTKAILTAEEARADWDTTPEDQRSGEPEGEFELWILGGPGYTAGFCLVTTRYTPIPDEVTD